MKEIKCIGEERIRQNIRNQATATLRRPQIKQYTAINEGGGGIKPKGTSYNFEKYEAVHPLKV